MEFKVVPKYLSEMVTSLLNGSKIIKIENDEQLKNSVTFIDNCKKGVRDLEVSRKEAVKPLNNQVDDINTEFKSAQAIVMRVVDNLTEEGIKYQKIKRAEAERLEREAALKAQEEQRRLAEIEDARILEAEKLEREAEAKRMLAEVETDIDKKIELEQSANLAIETANIATEEAIEASKAQAVEAVPFVNPVQVIAARGFNVEYKYSAKIVNHREFLRWVVSSNEFGFIEGQALLNLLQSGANKIANLKKNEFKISGCELVKTEVLK